MENEDVFDTKTNDKKHNELKGNSVLKNIIIVAFSNVIKLLSGVLVGLVIPKIMGETNYGYYKTYTLYLAYVGIFSFGFVDGIYLKYGGIKYNLLDKTSFRCYSRFFLIFQSCIALIICCLSIIWFNYPYGYIFLFLGVSLLANNITGYYQQISQITGRFKELSIRNLIMAILQAVSVVFFGVLYVSKVIDCLTYKTYILAWSLILIILSIWYIFTYRDILKGKSKGINNEYKNILNFFITGFPLLIANLVSSLILSIDKQFVNILVNRGYYSIEDFGIYSFAYTMLALITTVISAISTVLYPTIKLFNEDKLKGEYNKLISIIAMVTSLFLLSYQPLCFIVDHWLPEYKNSLPIFRTILPGVVLSSCVTIIIFNYYKTIGKQLRFFIISLFVLILSIVANFIAFFLTKQLIWISIASVIVIFIWYFISEFFLIRKWKINVFRNTIYVLLIICSFYVISIFIPNILIGFFSYLFVYIVLTFLFYRKFIVNKFFKK